MNPETLLVRADASPQMGTGHVMRCLALAQVWQQARGRVWFALARPAGPIREQLESAGCEVVELMGAVGSAEDANAVVVLAQKQQAAWVVADGYQFDDAYQHRLKEAELQLLLVDDYGHAKHYSADYVLNQNLGASATLYAGREATTRLLLGPRYLLLRKEFLKWREWNRPTPKVGRRVLVTLGGSDPDNVTRKVIEGLAGLRDCEATVVVGSNNPHWDELQAAAGGAGQRLRLLRNISNVPELMAEADVAVTAGGTTVWELAFMGLPALLITLADNQRSNVEQLAGLGAARALGAAGGLSSQDIAAGTGALLKDTTARQEMSRRGRTLVDGEGSFRVWLHLMESTVKLREATEGDCRLIWEWANDPEARRVSFSPEPIPWEDHVKWYAGKLQDKRAHLWVACDGAGRPIGQVRFDEQDGRAVISISLNPEHRGRNLGSLVIWLACRRLFQNTRIHAIRALIKPDHAASVRAFVKAGFGQAGTAVVNEQPAQVFELSPDRA